MPAHPPRIASWPARRAEAAPSTRGLVRLAGFCGGLILVMFAQFLSADEPAPVDFARQVEPIFKARCHGCHGPRKQQSGFRLDSRQAALAGGDSGRAAIVPGKPEDSPLIELVAGTGDLVMPPEGERLSAEQVRLLTAWVAQGANWPEEPGKMAAAEQHWAFRPIARPPVPFVGHPGFEVRNPIDAFILERMLNAGLRPNPLAEPRALARRLWFDLAGLPPTVAEIDEFLADGAPGAYERAVDRLLANPALGERWARHWLDLVRFAESHGFEMNQPRPNAWPYRDYVIRAFNQDLPYNQFIVEQLAGDTLGADEATGFLVAGPWDQVKSPDPVLTAQQRADELHDMVSTTGSAFLGLTVGCARCHGHKFDPIPQTDYYAIKACLAGVQHGERPLATADSHQRQALLANLERQRAPLVEALQAYEPLASLTPVVVIDDGAPGAARLLAPDAEVAYALGTGRGELHDPGSSTRLPNIGRACLVWKDRSGADLYTWTPAAGGELGVWVSWGCGLEDLAREAQYLIDGDGDPATAGDQRLIATIDQRLFADEKEVPRPARPVFSGLRFLGIHRFQPGARLMLRAGATRGSVTADVVVFQEMAGAGRIETGEVPTPALRAAVTPGANVERFHPIAARFVRFTILATSQSEPCLDELEIFTAEMPPRNVALASAGAKVSVSGTLPGFDIHQTAHVNDGRYGNSWSWISNDPGRGWVEIELPRAETIDRVVFSRDRDGRYQDRLPAAYRLEVSLDGQEWQTVATHADRLPQGLLPKTVAFRTLPAASPRAAAEHADLLSRLNQIEQQIAAARAQPMAYAGKLTTPEATHRLHRGDPTQPREEVAPGGLSRIAAPLAIPPDASEAHRRLLLARWIASDANPLAARVMVNRLWQHHFGRGLVDTPSDFGASGAPPSHPELLDWLAGQLIENGWRLKPIHRLILTSSTYRLSSLPNERSLGIDRDARWLWRVPPRRLEAETLRDAVLAVSGQLDRSMGGPGFDLFEPNTNYVKVYASKRVFGPETMRRMIYQSKPRMQLDDTFGVFDCPDAGQIAPVRHVSSTPLQALSLLNSPFMLEQSARFARRLRGEAGDEPRAQIARGFLLALGRPPEQNELEAALDLAEAHGIAAVCRALFNANEFLFVP